MTPEQPEIPSDPVEPDDPDVEPDQTDDPETTAPSVIANAEYESAAALPKGLTISTTDFTLRELGETHTIQASGSSGTYRWYSKDIGIASVDQSGKVTAVANGTTTVLVTDGSKKAECIVRVNAPAGQQATTTTPAQTTTSSGLKTGAAKVVNGGNGVRVRSGPGTSYEVLATVPNGADVQIVESAGDGWYKITFSNVGGATTPGYMKGDFLANQ